MTRKVLKHFRQNVPFVAGRRNTMEAPYVVMFLSCAFMFSITGTRARGPVRSAEATVLWAKGFCATRIRISGLGSVCCAATHQHRLGWPRVELTARSAAPR
jgi:hypothetical protein